MIAFIKLLRMQPTITLSGFPSGSMEALSHRTLRTRPKRDQLSETRSRISEKAKILRMSARGLCMEEQISELPGVLPFRTALSRYLFAT